MKKKCISLIMVLTLMMTALPFMSEDYNLHAASYLKTLNASATGQNTAALSWNGLTSSQKKKISGIAVFRNGSIIAYLGKTSTSFRDSGLKASTSYTYQIKCYKTKTKKTKYYRYSNSNSWTTKKLKKYILYYNKATGQWQKKKPAKKNRGGSKTITVKTKTVKTTTYSFSNASPSKIITTYRPPLPLLSAPTNFRTAQVTYEGVWLTWDIVHGADRYLLQKIGPGGKLYGSMYIFGTNAKDATVTQGEAYTYHVYAVRGNEISQPSGQVNVIIPAAPETEVTVYGQKITPDMCPITVTNPETICPVCHQGVEAEVTYNTSTNKFSIIYGKGVPDYRQYCHHHHRAAVKFCVNELRCFRAGQFTQDVYDDHGQRMIEYYGENVKYEVDEYFNNIGEGSIDRHINTDNEYNLVPGGDGHYYCGSNTTDGKFCLDCQKYYGCGLDCMRNWADAKGQLTATYLIKQ